MDKILKEIRQSQSKLMQVADDLLTGKISPKEARAVAKTEGAKGKAIQRQVDALAAMKRKR